MLNNIIQDIQYSKDNADQYGIKIDPQKENDSNSNLDAYLLSSALQIKNDLFPKIYQSISNVKDKLSLKDIYNFYVSPDNSSANAYCKVMPRSDRVDIVFTSRLIELLSAEELKFVVAHEIAHHQYQHYLYPSPRETESSLRYFNLVSLQKNAEISADRLGFLALGDLETTIKAMIKISSGLSSEYIKYNYDNFMSQLQDLKKLEKNPFLMNSSHPSIFTRAQSILWFSESKEYLEFTNSKIKGQYSLKEVDTLIEAALAELVSKDQDQIFGDRSRTCLFWCLIYLMSIDKNFSKKEQEYLSSIFTNEKVNSLKKYMESKKNNISQVLETRMREELQRSIDLPKSKKIEIREKIQDYLDRFIEKDTDEHISYIKAFGKILGILKVQ